MHYPEFRYIVPPRPQVAIPASLLPLYERRGWWAQIKMNGSNTLIFVAPDKSLRAMNRHGELHKNWCFSQATGRVFKQLPGSAWYVINAELLHNKVKGVQDRLYIFDILVCGGEYLLGSNYAERMRVLHQLFKPQIKLAQQWQLDDRVFMVRSFARGFETLFDHLQDASAEGLVLKNPRGVLDGSRSDWMVKCRKTHKNFAF